MCNLEKRSDVIIHFASENSLNLEGLERLFSSKKLLVVSWIKLLKIVFFPNLGLFVSFGTPAPLHPFEMHLTFLPGG